MTTVVSGFPVELLQAPVKARLEYFRSYTIVHPHLKSVYREFMQHLKNPADVSLVAVIGPTGVGKSTIMRKALADYVQEFRARENYDPGHMPISMVEAPAPAGSPNFDWKAYYVAALAALSDPFLAYKCSHSAFKDPAAYTSSIGVRGSIRGRATANANVLREEFEEATRRRNLDCFLIDEAQHFLKVSTGRRSLDQMDALKSMAGLTNTVHGLLGTYELLALRDLSGQLSRRSVEIHFRRYNSQSTEECTYFIQTLMGLLRQLPVRQYPDLERHWEFCYARSVGIIGILKEWLFRALVKALDEGAITVTRQHLEATAMSATKCLRIARETLLGEAAFLERLEDEHRLHEFLWGKSAAPSDTPKPNKAKTKPSPGVRKPSRDPVGLPTESTAVLSINEQ